MIENVARMMVSKSKELVNDELKGRLWDCNDLRGGLAHFVCHVPV